MVSDGTISSQQSETTPEDCKGPNNPIEGQAGSAQTQGARRWETKSAILSLGHQGAANELDRCTPPEMDTANENSVC